LSLLANNGLPSPNAPILDLKISSLDVLGDLDAALALGESTSEVRVLSSPRVMTMQNESASISQQVNIPYTTNNQATAGTGGSPAQIAPQVAFLTTQLALNVTPQITNDSTH
jgi:type IV pilus assembly protein PilQ